MPRYSDLPSGFQVFIIAEYIGITTAPPQPLISTMRKRLQRIDYYNGLD
jgi:hypothetical protein